MTNSKSSADPARPCASLRVEDAHPAPRTGAVHECAQTVAVVGHVERGGELLPVGDIGGRESRCGTELFGHLGTVGGRQVDEGHLPAGIDDAPGGGQAEAGGSSGDGGGEVLEFHTSAPEVVSR